MFGSGSQGGVAVSTFAVSDEGLVRDVSDIDSRIVVVLLEHITSRCEDTTESHLVDLEAFESDVEVG